MVQFLRDYHIRILIGIACYLAGFSVTAVLLDLTHRDIVVGLIAGAVCGITIIIVTVGNSFVVSPQIRRRLHWLRP